MVRLPDDIKGGQKQQFAGQARAEEKPGPARQYRPHMRQYMRQLSDIICDSTCDSKVIIICDSDRIGLSDILDLAILGLGDNLDLE